MVSRSPQGSTNQEDKGENGETRPGQAECAQRDNNTGKRQRKATPAVAAVTNHWAPAAGGMVPTPVPQDWLLRKFSVHL